MTDRMIGRRGVVAGAVAAGAALALPRPLRAARASKRPNILFIMADDMGYADLSCYGSRHIRTPVLDRLAAQGVRFTDGYAASPVCSPTRLALATGRYHTRFRTGLVEPFSAGPWGDQAIPPGQSTMPGELRKAGYRTALVGKWHLGETVAGGPLAHGYDEFFGFLGGGLDYFTHEYRGRPALRENGRVTSREGYMTGILGDEAIAALRRFADKPAPFALSLHFSAPHWPWEGPEDSELGTQGPHFDGGSLQIYAQMMESMDRNIGRVLTELDNLGLAEDTIVVFTSDNGGERFSEVWPFRGMKGSLLEGGIRVPSILRYPAKMRGGQDSAVPNLTIDWMTTFLDAAGVPASRRPELDGIALLPVLAGEASGKRDLFWRFQGRNQRAMRSANWKYYRLGEHEFLFDLSQDTMERANRAKAEPDRLNAMRAGWEKWNERNVTADDAPGFCQQASKMAEPLDNGPDSNCKPPSGD